MLQRSGRINAKQALQHPLFANKESLHIFLEKKDVVVESDEIGETGISEFSPNDKEIKVTFKTKPLRPSFFSRHCGTTDFSSRNSHEP
jgi:hypothetical protein